MFKVGAFLLGSLIDVPVRFNWLVLQLRLGKIHVGPFAVYCFNRSLDCKKEEGGG